MLRNHFFRIDLSTKALIFMHFLSLIASLMLYIMNDFPILGRFSFPKGAKLGRMKNRSKF